MTGEKFAGTLESSNSPAALAQAGSHWTWDDSLADAGLQVVQEGKA